MDYSRGQEAGQQGHQELANSLPDGLSRQLLRSVVPLLEEQAGSCEPSACLFGPTVGAGQDEGALSRVASLSADGGQEQGVAGDGLHATLGLPHRRGRLLTIPTNLDRAPRSGQLQNFSHCLIPRFTLPLSLTRLVTPADGLYSHVFNMIVNIRACQLPDLG